MKYGSRSAPAITTKIIRILIFSYISAINYVIQSRNAIFIFLFGISGFYYFLILFATILNYIFILTFELNFI